MDHSRSWPWPTRRSFAVTDTRTPEVRSPLRAALPDGWESDVAAEVAADLLVPVLEHARFRPVLLKLLSKLDAALPLEAAAKLARLSPCSFSRRFPLETGFHFCSWDCEIRIRIAAYLLRESGRSITSIGYVVGYSDRTTFSRAFKRCHGIAATAYRRSQSFAANARGRAALRRARARMSGKRLR